MPELIESERSWSVASLVVASVTKDRRLFDELVRAIEPKRVAWPTWQPRRRSSRSQHPT
jgi:hypothetical protein